MLYSIDRIEGQLVELVGDDESRLQLCIGQFAFPLEEGMLVERTEDGFVPDSAATYERRRALADKMKELLDRKNQIDE